MGREGKRSGSFTAYDGKKLNQCCPYNKNKLCIRQKRMCNNKDVFFENCVVYNGNNVLNSFMRPRKYFNPNISVNTESEQEESVKAVEKAEVVEAKEESVVNQ